MPEAERVKIGLCCLWVFCHEEQQDLMRDFIQIKSENIQQCLCFHRRLFWAVRGSQESGLSWVRPRMLKTVCAMKGREHGKTVIFSLYSLNQMCQSERSPVWTQRGGFLHHVAMLCLMMLRSRGKTCVSSHLLNKSLSDGALPVHNTVLSSLLALHFSWKDQYWNIHQELPWNSSCQAPGQVVSLETSRENISFLSGVTGALFWTWIYIRAALLLSPCALYLLRLMPAALSCA